MKTKTRDGSSEQFGARVDSALVSFVMRLAAEDTRRKSDAVRFLLEAGAVRALIRAAWAKAKAAPPHLRELWTDNAAMIEVCYLTSSRISQVLTLRRDQVAGGMLRFPSHKLGRPREFALEGRLGTVLAKVPVRGGPFFFPARVGSTKDHRDNLRRFWKDVAPAGFTVHGLRHSSITAALEAGEAPMDAARRGGWKSLAMLVRTYGHILGRPIGGLPRAGKKTAGTSSRSRRTPAGKESRRSKSSRPRKSSSGRPGASSSVAP